VVDPERGAVVVVQAPVAAVVVVAVGVKSTVVAGGIGRRGRRHVHHAISIAGVLAGFALYRDDGHGIVEAPDAVLAVEAAESCRGRGEPGAEEASHTAAPIELLALQ
jgi:hypothetical protein